MHGSSDKSNKIYSMFYKLEVTRLTVCSTLVIESEGTETRKAVKKSKKESVSKRRSSKTQDELDEENTPS